MRRSAQQQQATTKELKWTRMSLFFTDILVTKYAVNIIKLIYAGGCTTTKLNSFHLGYFPIYLGYGDCKFESFLHCLLLINKTTTLVCESNNR